MKRFLLAVLLLGCLACATARGETAYNLLNQHQRTGMYDLSVIPDLLRSNANVFFVGSTATEALDSADGLHGETMDRPFATYDFAVGRCTASSNNVIVLLPYHTENVTAGSVDIDISGITTIGLGYGPARPRFVSTATSSTFVVGRNGDGATIMNIVLVPSVNAVVVGVQVEDGADDITFIDCEWESGEAAGVDEFITAVDCVTEVNDLAFIRCRWTSLAAGATALLADDAGAIGGLTFKDCYAYGDWSTALMVSDQALTRVLIENCSFYQANGGEPIFEFTGTSNVGTVRHCTLVNDGTANDMGGVSLVGNDYQTSGDSNTDGRAYSLADDGVTAAKIATDALGSDELAATAAAEIAAAVGDEAVAGHRTAATFGAMLQPLHSGTAAAGAAGTITLQNTASALADFYNGNLVQIIAGTGIGQSRLITDYAVTTFIASVAPNWITNPSSDSVYVVSGQGPVRVEALTPDVVTAAGIANDALDWATLAADLKNGIEDDIQETMDANSLQYWQERTLAKTATSQTDDLFDVAGGPILITSMYGVVTTAIGGAGNTIKLNLDADAGWEDYDFSTAVETNADAQGTRYTFSNAALSVLTPQEGTAGGASSLMAPWHCGEGMIEQTCSGATTGAIKWYMTYKPLAAGVTVTAQ